jgi:hypothetical protein
MKISVNDTELYTLAQWEKDVIQHDVPTEGFDADMKRRLEWVLKHKVEQCYNSFEKEWIDKLRIAGVPSIPIDKAQFVALVKARPEYKNRSQRDAEAH